MISEGVRFDKITVLTDRMPQNAASDQGLHCLQFVQQCYTHSQEIKWTC